MRRRDVLAGAASAALAGHASRANGVVEMTAAETEAALAGTWEVTAVANATIPAGVVPLLIFDAAGLRVFGGCNGFSYQVTYLADGQLRFSPPQLNTRASCDAATSAVESQVLNAFQRINAFTVAEGKRLAMTGFGSFMIDAVRQD